MKYLKQIIIAVLILEARLVLWRFKPKIIAVVGSVGKTSTKDAIYTALKDVFYIRKNQKSLNSEIGAPLTILGLENAWKSPLLWAKNIFLGILQLFKRTYPAWLVLEVGADHPGDIHRLARWLKPDVVVVTAMPDIPVHVEFFESPEALIAEDLAVISYMKKDGVLVINADEPRTPKVIEESKVKTITYGSAERADVRFDSQTIVYDTVGGVSVPTGVSCKVAYNGSTVPISLHGVLGVTHIYPVVAALATGLSQQVPFLSMTQALAQHQPPRGRMNIIEGKNGSTIIDDSYNASPVAVERALETLAVVDTQGNKIAILGDMLEIGSYTAAEHKRIGTYVVALGINYLVTIGLRSEYTAQTAIAAGMDPEHVFSVRTSEEAIDVINPILKQGDIVLVKGSQSIRAEKVVVAIMEHPEDRKQLLIRQETAWEHR